MGNSKLLQQHFAKNYKQATAYTSHETELGLSCSFFEAISSLIDNLLYFLGRQLYELQEE